MPRIFISYRRDDTGSIVDALDHELVVTFGHNHVYRDIRSVQPGVDWHLAIERIVTSSDILLAVLGSNWVGRDLHSERRRIDRRDDTVRMEVAAALSARVVVLPLRVNGAAVPSARELPLEVAKLSRLNAVQLRADHWRQDIVNIANHIRQSARSTSGSSAPRTSALLGDWMAQELGVVFTYTFNRDGTYSFLGVAQTRTSSVSAVDCETSHEGEYELGRDILHLTQFRSTVSVIDHRFPQRSTHDRPQALRELRFKFRLADDRLTLIDADGQGCTYLHVLGPMH